MIKQVNFFREKVKFRLTDAEKIKKWVFKIITNEELTAGTVNIIFCSDNHLKKINKQYLNHDYFTDILTFENNYNDIVSGDVFISIDRIRLNAKEYRTTLKDELHRVIAHGILHLAGYKDHNKKSKNAMRLKEDECLSMRKF